ncbi:MAG: CPBP family intramembrane metalloprotease [Tannerella sp.]|jgi:membrane protease YdiL (CAAX protease family)|nr:CPBP family intramembrane metalloprotease [Tannerella sp.]
MQKLFFEPILHILILVPFAILFLKENSKINFWRIFIFSICYIVYQIFLVLPKINPVFDFIKSEWNWDGKIFGIVWAITAYFLFRKFFKENDFFTLEQNKKGLKNASLGATSIVILSTVVWFILGKSKLDYETLAFQISLPGIDEEMIFRGILLGLLLNISKEKIPFIGNPSILVTAVLFGFMHALTMNNNYSVNFETIYFLQTAFAGYIWGWITLKSRSILLAILSHNFSNFFGTFATMMK